MLQGGQEVIIGAVTDPSFGKLVAFGLGGVLVEVLKDVDVPPGARVEGRRARRCSTASQAARDAEGRARRATPVDRDALRRCHPEACRSSSPTFPRSPSSTSIRCSLPRTARSPPTCGSSSTSRPQPERYRPSQDEIVRADEPHHEARRGRGDRRVGRGRQDRQLGDEEPDQRRLPGQDLPDQSVRRRDHGAQGVQERQGRAGRHRRRGVRDSRQVRRAGAHRGRREEDSRRGADSVGLRRDRQRRRASRRSRPSAASTACA